MCGYYMYTVSIYLVLASCNILSRLQHLWLSAIRTRSHGNLPFSKRRNAATYPQLTLQMHSSYRQLYICGVSCIVVYLSKLQHGLHNSYTKLCKVKKKSIYPSQYILIIGKPIPAKRLQAYSKGLKWLSKILIEYVFALYLVVEHNSKIVVWGMLESWPPNDCCHL